jgi:hypothetical protein
MRRIDEDLDFGVCCSCRDRRATGFVMLRLRAPVPRTGWGCLVCHLPQNGAVAALCDQCGADPKAEIRDVCFGAAITKRRAPIETCTKAFDHNIKLHAKHERQLVSRTN